MTGLHKTLGISLAALALGACSKDTTGPTHVSISPSASIAFGTKGRNVTVHAAVVSQAGDTLRRSGFSWSSSKTSVVLVSGAAGDSAVLTSVGAGSATVTVASGGAQGTISVSVTVVPTSATITGDHQVVSPGRRLGFPLVLTLRDSLGNAAAGDTVHFAVTAGGGSITVSQAIADVNGRVSTAWTVGASGTQTVTATAPGYSHDLHAEIVPSTGSSFVITVVNVGSPFRPEVQAAFDSAAAFWGRVITAGLKRDSIVPPLPEGSPTKGCGTGFPAVGPLVIDQVVVLAIIRPIDGPANILGGAGPCIVRTTQTNPDTLAPTLIGAAEFDSADIDTMIAQGQLSTVVRHEMGHVLGFGTFWDGYLGLEDNGDSLFGKQLLFLPASTGAFPDTYYGGARGRAVFDSIGGTNYTGGNKVPVENCAGLSNCGPGTFNSHWRESVFRNELMTGFIDATNPASALTLAQFQDLGYQVDLTKAETYSQPFHAPSAFRLISARRSLGNDARRVRFAMTPHGLVRIGAAAY